MITMLPWVRKPDPHVARDPFREFQIPGGLDRLLYAVLSVDLLLVKLGITLPMGESLLLVARKA